MPSKTSAEREQCESLFAIRSADASAERSRRVVIFSFRGVAGLPHSMLGPYDFGVAGVAGLPRAARRGARGPRQTRDESAVWRREELYLRFTSLRCVVTALTGNAYKKRKHGAMHGAFYFIFLIYTRQYRVGGSTALSCIENRAYFTHTAPRTVRFLNRTRHTYATIKYVEQHAQPSHPVTLARLGWHTMRSPPDT
jgi:hypothetical protein